MDCSDCRKLFLAALICNKKKKSEVNRFSDSPGVHVKRGCKRVCRRLASKNRNLKGVAIPADRDEPIIGGTEAGGPRWTHPRG